MNDKIKIRFADCEPKGFQLIDIKKKLANLLRVSPSDSRITAEWSQLGLEFHGIIKINSKSGLFTAEAHDLDILESAKALNLSLLEELKNWKRVRFQSSLDSSISIS